MPAPTDQTQTHLPQDLDATQGQSPVLGATTDGEDRTSGHTSSATPGLINNRYALGDEIARGGMGVVYSAHDRFLDRAVALKTVREDRTVSEGMVRRFVFESQVTGRLQHPGVPPVHDLGMLPDGRPFLVMKLIKGRTLADHLAERAGDRDRWLRPFEQLAEAVGFAHAEGVIHRDLKPANIMLGAFGEVQVMDWGLAKVTGKGEVATGSAEDDDESDRTQAGSVMGTPAYMAPEQARGEIDQLGPSADVFALGAILCEVLTGKPPFVGASTRTIIAQAAAANTADAILRLDRCGAPEELIAIASRCLAGKPEDRPGNGLAVAQMIAEYRAGVEARLRRVETERAATEAKAQEARRRRRTQMALAASVVVTMMLAGGGLMWRSAHKARQASEIARQATTALAEATNLRERARQQPNELARWDATLAAITAARSAVEDEDADPTTRQQVQDLASAIEVEAAAARKAYAVNVENRELIAQLEEARFVASQRAEGEKFNDAAQDEAYAKLFAELGLVVNEGDPADAARKLGRPLIASELASSLDDWARSRGKARGLTDPGKQWLLRVAQQLDKDKTRNLVRDEVIAGVPEKIFARMADPKTIDLPVETLLCLASAVPDHHDQIAHMLRQVWAKRPTDYWVAVELGRCLLPMGRNEEAGRSFSAAITLRPNVPGPYYSLGYALSMLNRNDLAIEAYQRVTELEPKSPWAHLLLADRLTRLGKKEVALKHHKLGAELAKDRSAEEYAYYMEQYGFSLLNNRHIPEAIAVSRQAIALSPKSQTALSCLGHALVMNGDVAEGVTEFEKCLALRPASAVRLNSFAIALRGSKDYRSSEKYCRLAIAADPNYAAAHADLGWALYLQGQVDLALESLRRSVAIQPNLFWGHYCLGVILQDARQDLATAAGHYRNAIQARPTDFTTHERMTFVLSVLNDHDGAIAAGRKAIRLAPQEAIGYAHLGFALKQKGEIVEALEHLTTAISLKKDHVPALHWIGDVLILLGDPASALPHAKRAIELAPGNVWAQITVANAYHGLGQMAEAKHHFRLAAKDPRTAPFLPPDWDKD